MKKDKYNMKEKKNNMREETFRMRRHWKRGQVLAEVSGGVWPARKSVGNENQKLATLIVYGLAKKCSYIPIAFRVCLHGKGGVLGRPIKLGEK